MAGDGDKVCGGGIRDYGEEPMLQARAVGGARNEPIHTTRNRRAVGKAVRTHASWAEPATRTFRLYSLSQQAEELARVPSVMISNPWAPGGDLSLLEDRIVKQSARDMVRDNPRGVPIRARSAAGK